MTQWGRDPGAGRWIYAGPLLTGFVLVVAIGAFGWLGKMRYDHLSPLQHQWFPTVLKSTLAAAVRLDPLEYTFQGKTGPRDNAEARDYLTRTVYDGEPLWRMFLIPLAAGGALLGLVIPAMRADLQRGIERRQGRYLKGARLLPAKPFNRAVRPRRWRRGFRRDDQGHTVRQQGAPAIVLPRTIENSHASIVADTGGGKTTLIHEYCEEAERRGETAVIYDADGTFLQTWWKPERGDVILSPGDARTWAWDSGDEVRDPLEAMALATSLIPKDPVETNKFFTNSARSIVAYLLTLKQSPQQMVDWLTDQRRLMRLLHGTHIQDVLPVDSAGQRAGVMSPLNMLAVSLAMCPTPKECGGRVWSAAKWAETRTGWIFVTGTPATREQLRPMQTLWFDALILRTMTVPGPPVKMCLDELASLQKLWHLPTALTEGRKHGLSVVFGFQGRGQLDDLYGKQAETMLSQAAAQYVLRVADGRAAETASKNIGQAEMERIEESRQVGYRRAGVSYSLRRAPEFLFMPSQIQGFEDLRGVLKVRNFVTTLQIPIVRRPERTAAFVPRLSRVLRKPVGPPGEALTFEPPLEPAALPNPME
jgi:hypothetical protein